MNNIVDNVLLSSGRYIQISSDDKENIGGLNGMSGKADILSNMEFLLYLHLVSHTLMPSGPNNTLTFCT